MLGISLLVIAILTYVLDLKKISLFIFTTFMLNGWCVLTDDVLGVKNFDMAVIYTFVVLGFSLLFEKNPRNFDDSKLKPWLYLFLGFMVLDIIFSYNHYEFTPYQIVQGCRASFLFLSYFFLRKAKVKDLLWINEIFFYITLVTSVLYILEVFFDLPVLPYDEEGAKIDDYTGIMRFYNSPPLLYWYIFISVLSPNLLKSKLTFPSIFVFTIALIATLGRIQIAMTAVVLLVGLIIQGRIKSILTAAVALLVLTAPFAQILSARFAGKFEDSTSSEIKNIFNGSIQETVYVGNSKDVGTLTYRLAWIYERADFLSDRPISENIFGLGLISDSQTLKVQSMYNFELGLIDEEENMAQLTTPDISYGNLLSKYGYVGGVLYLMIWLQILATFIKRRKEDEMAFVGMLLIINCILLGFSGTTISDQGYLITPFLAYVLLIHKISENSEEKKRNEHIALT